MSPPECREPQKPRAGSQPHLDPSICNGRHVRIHQSRTFKVASATRRHRSIQYGHRCGSRHATHAVCPNRQSPLFFSIPRLALMSTSTVAVTALRMPLVLLVTCTPAALVSCAHVVAAEIPISCCPREQRPRPNLARGQVLAKKTWPNRQARGPGHCSSTIICTRSVLREAPDPFSGSLILISGRTSFSSHAIQ